MRSALSELTALAEPVPMRDGMYDVAAVEAAHDTESP